MSNQGSDQEEYEDQEAEDDEDGMDEKTFTHEEFLQGPTKGMIVKNKESLFACYKEHDRLKGFGIVKKTSNKKGADYIREVSRSLKIYLVAHDIADLRPSKNIRLLEVQDGGPENMRCTPKDCRNYILQQRRLRTLTTNGEAISREDAATYNFILSTWRKNMKKVKLTDILTDQRESIKASLRVVMPDTIHGIVFGTYSQSCLLG
ncbi:hypothetical protein RND71_013831 [Anisodus tanguticus]|uniref:Uncharacterized protein n=1 Tax=Anisodus tanguticus TaxID=243964 RepID=A0AAE1VJD6_9SOLA|nr:hypothetical protein RND71_013831 [Anisodus tanguticus]